VTGKCSKPAAGQQHLDLSTLYRRKIEALRSLIDVILAHPGERRGEVLLSLRGNVTAFLHFQPESDGCMTAVR